MSYKQPSVNVTVLDNPRIINIGDTTRIPAVVGLGPTSISVTDEAVVRGTGSIDYLSAYSPSTTGVTITQIANQPGVNGGLASVFVSLQGNLYNPASGSAGAQTGTFQWPVGTLPVPQDVPATGSVYYVSYSYNVPTSQFAPFMFSDKLQIKARYGAQDNLTGILTAAGLIALENGAPAVWLVQATGSVTQVPTSYYAAIDQLKTKTNIEQLCLVFPSGSVTRATQMQVVTYALSHLAFCNANGKERGFMFGSPSPQSASDGIDPVLSIGDVGTPGTLVYLASTVKTRDVCYIVPTRIQRYNDNGQLFELDGNYGAVAIAGIEAAQDQRSTPIDGFTVAGLVIQDEMWNDTQMNTLGAGNCTVLESRGGVVTIRDWLTTDPTSANTTEPTVVALARLVKRTLRTGLYNVYTNKGKVITPTTTNDVVATTRSILQGLVNINELFDFGHRDNPATGELSITAQVDLVDPRQINVTCSVKYLYPLKFISVTVSTYV